MRNRTKELSNKIQELEYVEDRLELLHDTYSDCKAVILAPAQVLMTTKLKGRIRVKSGLSCLVYKTSI